MRAQWGHGWAQGGDGQGQTDQDRQGYRQRQRHLWGWGLEGGKEEEIDRDAHEPGAGDEGVAGLDGTFHPQALPGTWPPKAPSP